MDLKEFFWAFCHYLAEAGLRFDDDSFLHLSSLEIANEEEDDDDDEKYILHIKAGKTAVFDGVRLPLQIALKAVAIALQRQMRLTVIDVTEAEGGADILFKTAGDYGIETGVVDAGE